jgi:hypothetical protein
MPMTHDVAWEICARNEAATITDVVRAVAAEPGPCSWSPTVESLGY